MWQYVPGPKVMRAYGVNARPEHRLQLGDSRGYISGLCPSKHSNQYSNTAPCDLNK